jgi:hypothetical protein
MTAIAEVLGPLLLAALVVWYLGSPLLRLAAISCFVCTAGLLALGDAVSALGVGGCGLAGWVGWQLLYRARRGRWRSARAARIFSREIAGPSHYGGAHPPKQKRTAARASAARLRRPQQLHVHPSQPSTVTTTPSQLRRSLRSQRPPSLRRKQPVRSALRRGHISIAAVMREQPAGPADRTLFEVLLMAHQFGRQRLCALNARAVDEHVNLAVTLDAADYDVREWGRAQRAAARPDAPRDTWAQLMAD